MSSEFFLSTSSSIGPTSSQEGWHDFKSERMPNFILPGSAASPPQILTLHEIRFAVQNIKDMQLAHEIAINPDVCLQSNDPPETNLEKRIKTHVHNWDYFRHQLNRGIYDHAIVLLGEIKQNFSFIVPENAEKALKCINDNLDENIIRKEADNGTIDLKARVNFIIQWMAQLSTRCREYEVNKLMDIDDIVVKFRRILEIMDHMKSDVTNFLLETIRNEVMTYSINYEKRQFNENLVENPDGFPATAAWLQRNICIGPNEQLTKTNTLFSAYLEFFDWNPEFNYPETMSIDKERMLELAMQALRLCCIVSIMAIIERVSIISNNSENRFEVMNEAALLLEDISNEKELVDSIENIWEAIRSVILSKHEEYGKNMAADMESAMKDRIISLANKDSAIRTVMWSQLMSYIRLAKSNKKLPPVPPNYSEVSDELQTLANTFKRFTIYNYSVFGEHYEKIIDGLTKSVNQEQNMSETDNTSDGSN